MKETDCHLLWKNLWEKGNARSLLLSLRGASSQTEKDWNAESLCCEYAGRSFALSEMSDFSGSPCGAFVVTFEIRKMETEGVSLLYLLS